MDAAWKVYVQDRRFDDDQISNCFLKMKYETVGRFTFDFRAIDGDESYMVVGNTLRIFWGDLHKMDGVIQRVDWDDDNWCYKVYGADIRGFLLDRVNTEPATVSSYTSDVTSQVMFTGCDFPTNIWTGAGESIGKYTFHYKIGIQNTIRITSATNIWHNVIERGTVYDHVNGCLYDATKAWSLNEHNGRILRFVSGACKNNVYNINGNTSNRVCIRLPGEPATMYSVVGSTDNVIGNGTFPDSTITDPWEIGYISYPQYGATVQIVSGGYGGGNCLYAHAESGIAAGRALIKQAVAIEWGTIATFRYKGRADAGVRGYVAVAWEVSGGKLQTTGVEFATQQATTMYNPSWPDWDVATISITSGTGNLFFGAYTSFGKTEVWVDDIVVDAAGGGAEGKIPGCSRRGDIYEIVFASMERIEPASILPATLEKDNHIIRYNRVNSLSDHVTSMTIRGT